MDTSLASQSPDTSDAKPSFRKPSNDASHRKYRRHSPVSGSSSPSSSGGFKRDRSMSPNASQGEGAKTADSSKRARRNDGGRDSFRDYDRVHCRRGPDAREMTERHSYSRSRDYHSRSDDYNYNRRHGGTDDRDHQRYTSHSGRDSRSSIRSEYLKRDGDYDKLSRDDRWNAERGSRERGFNEGSRKMKEMEKDRDKDNGSKYRYKNMDREICTERPKIGSRYSNADMDIEEVKSRDKDGTNDLGRDRDGSRDRSKNRDDNREHSRDLGGNKLEQKRSRDEVRGRDKDSIGDRDESRSRARDKYKTGEKDSESYKDDKVQLMKREDFRERDRNKEKHSRESDRHSKCESKGPGFYKDRDEKKERDRYQDDEGNARKGQESDQISRNAREGKQQSDLSGRDGRRHHPVSEDAGQLQGKTASVDDTKSAKNTNMVPEAEGLSEPSSSTATEAEVAHDLNVAKLAAMKAAELVNKNLGVSGYMSADQKKRLLWGSKKATAVEESGSNQWNMAHFTDPDRQEKFKKLMSLSVPCYIWPIVGCQGRGESRTQSRRQKWWAACSREANGTAARPGKAVHGRIKAPRWSDCWIRSIGITGGYVVSIICLLGKIVALAEWLIIVSVYLASKSDRNRFINSFFLTFPCHLNYGFILPKQCSHLFFGMDWHNLDNGCIFF